MYTKKGYPEEGEFIICTISNVLPHAVFADLDEYDKKEGMIHTSEMDRRWVRNMKVYLKIGRQLVCKVMDVDKEKGQINLSIRRVGEGQRRSKLQTWKNEKRADDLLQFFAKKNKQDIEDLYKKFDENIISNYDGIYPFMLEVTRLGEETLKELNIQSKIAHELFDLIKQRIKIPKAEINGELHMHSIKGDGLNAIKKAVKEIETIAKNNDYEVTINYMGAPKYQIKISADHKKKAEQASEDIVSKLQSLLGGKSNVEFVRSRS
jgi:translation initiation factor 2 subunit 1